MFAAVLFDLDGTLTDTDRLKFQAHRDIIRQLGGEAVPDEVFERLLGRSREETVRSILRAAALKESRYDRYKELQGEQYEALAKKHARAHAGVLEFLQLLKSEGVRRALVTSSNERSTRIVLETTGLGPHLEVVVTSDDVVHRKPHPEPYLLALRLLNLEPRQAIVLEDTDPGCSAAMEAELKVVAVRHTLNTGQRLETPHKISVDDYQDPRKLLELLNSLSS